MDALDVFTDCSAIATAIATRALAALLLFKTITVLLARRAPGRPPKVPAKVPGVSPAGQSSELVLQRSEKKQLKGEGGLLEEQLRERDAQLAAVHGERQWADALLKERDAQLLADGSAAMKAEHGWRTREKKLLDKLEAARGPRGTKRTAPEALAVRSPCRSSAPCPMSLQRTEAAQPPCRLA